MLDHIEEKIQLDVLRAEGRVKASVQQEKLFCILQFFQPPSTALFIGFPAERIS